MKITLLVEGRTEKAFLPHLRNFLQSRLAGRMPNLDPAPYHGRIPTYGKLERVVRGHLTGRNPSGHVTRYPMFTPGRFRPTLPMRRTLNPRCGIGWATNQDFTLTRRSSTSKRGSFHTGLKSNNWQVITEQRQEETPNWSITIGRPPIALRKCSVWGRAVTTM